MFTIREPSPTTVDKFLRQAKGHAFSYSEVGLTRGGDSAGYTVDHNRVTLGAGPRVFRDAVSALRAWQMFNLGWVRVFPRDAPITVGTTVVVVIRHFGFWSMNASRIIYLIEEDQRLGFAYGTLSHQHAEQGEERFSVEWNSESDLVTYDLLAFSRPQEWQAKVALPVVRRLQRKFARDSMEAMVRAVSSE